MEWYKAKTNNAHGQGLVIDAETGDNIAIVYDGTNSDLIAAAPEMLECLDQLVEVYGCECVDNTQHCPICQARAAIRKAMDGQTR